MNYGIFYTKQSEAELLALPSKIQRQIRAKIARLQGGFSGEIKKLTPPTTFIACWMEPRTGRPN